MLSDKKKTTYPTDAAYEAAIKGWHCLCQSCEASITMRSIFVAVRLALPNVQTPEDRNDLEWLLDMGKVLADIEGNRPEDEN